MESDAKRLVANAKSYNEKDSEVWADAERVRKITSDFMRKNNPAYKDPRYAAFATPLPGEASPPDDPAPQDDGPSARPTPSPQPSSLRPAADLTPIGDLGASPAPDAAAATTTAGHVLVSSASTLTGKSFRDAQETIIAELINLQDDQYGGVQEVQKWHITLTERGARARGQDIAGPFLNLPPRKLNDYYALIKKPVSLKGIQKRVRGVHGRHETTGQTDFPSWSAFDDEVSLIWRNAREYNEDGSEISVLAGKLEVSVQRWRW